MPPSEPSKRITSLQSIKSNLARLTCLAFSEPSDIKRQKLFFAFVPLAMHCLPATQLPVHLLKAKLCARAYSLCSIYFSLRAMTRTDLPPQIVRIFVRSRPASSRILSRPSRPTNHHHTPERPISAQSCFERPSGKR
jgi:hypothetical protein